MTHTATLTIALAAYRRASQFRGSEIDPAILTAADHLADAAAELLEAARFGIPDHHMADADAELLDAARFGITDLQVAGPDDHDPIVQAIRRLGDQLSADVEIPTVVMLAPNELALVQAGLELLEVELADHDSFEPDLPNVQVLHRWLAYQEARQRRDRLATAIPTESAAGTRP